MTFGFNTDTGRVAVALDSSESLISMVGNADDDDDTAAVDDDTGFDSEEFDLAVAVLVEFMLLLLMLLLCVLLVVSCLRRLLRRFKGISRFYYINEDKKESCVHKFERMNCLLHVLYLVVIALHLRNEFDKRNDLA